MVMHRVRAERYSRWTAGFFLLVLALLFFGSEFPFGCAKRSDDLPEILERKTLRLLTRNSYGCYFIYRGAERGFEYELAERFARELGVKLEVIIPPTWEDLVPWLIEGKGDLIAVPLTITPELSRKIRFADSYRSVQQVVVVRQGNDELKSPEDLSGRSIWVPGGGRYERQLRLQEREMKKKIKIVPVGEDLETEDMLSLLAEGEIDATVADDLIARVEIQYQPNLEIAFSISEPREVAWGVRRDSKELLKSVNRFWEEAHRSTFYNILEKRYFSYLPTRYQSGVRQISPYDHLIKKYSAEYGFDWLLIAAQAYEESRFDPEAQSWAGAMGLMQLMPKTAQDMEVIDPFDPEQNILGGVKYLRYLMRMFQDVPAYDRLKFALAAYNVGIEHIRDAQQLADMLGLDPLSWEGSVQETLPLLSHRQYYRKVESGYCRGWSGVRYVDNILERTEIYRKILEEEKGFTELAREKLNHWKQFLPFLR